MQLRKGDRVRLSPHVCRWNVRNPDRLGTVTSSKNSVAVTVLWDGRKTIDRYSTVFIEKVNDGVNNIV